MPTIVGIAGSARRGSYNRRLLELAAGEMRSLRVDVDLVEPETLDGLPIYNADLQAASGIPAAVVDLHRRVTTSDGVLIASPEYNGAFSPLLKNTIDWITRVEMTAFRAGPIGLMAASPGGRGGAHGLDIVSRIFRYMGCTVFEPSFSLPKAGDALVGRTDGSEGESELVDAEAGRLHRWVAAYLDAVDTERTAVGTA